MKKILVLGAGGFIGSHLIKKLKKQGHYVTGVDLCLPKFGLSAADQFIIADLRNAKTCQQLFESHTDEIYQLAADMGSAGYVFSGNNDAEILHNSALINLNIANELMKNPKPKIFFSSSACVYPRKNQVNPNNPNCEETTAYLADPDSAHGWEKLFSEKLYSALNSNFGVDIRIGRYHNVYGIETSYNNGREKAPAAICYKVAVARNGKTIDIWGDGLQTRSFLYIDDCTDATIRLMESNFLSPINIGSEQIISIADLTHQIINISNKNLDINYIPGPVGVAGRNSNNALIKKILNWEPTVPLDVGLRQLYNWVDAQVNV